MPLTIRTVLSKSNYMLIMALKTYFSFHGLRVAVRRLLGQLSMKPVIG